nr:glycoside hydrolase family 125 protein [Cerasicoccus maritimus]
MLKSASIDRSKAVTHVNLGIDVHSDSYVVVHQVDGSTPQTSQRFYSRERFLRHVSKQQSEAVQVYTSNESVVDFQEIDGRPDTLIITDDTSATRPRSAPACERSRTRTRVSVSCTNPSTATTPAQFSRPWFAWANTLFGELILQIQGKCPNLLQETFADKIRGSSRFSISQAYAA